MANPTLVALLVSVLAGATAAEDFDKPIPQDPAKRTAQDRKLIAWSRRTISEPYDKVGKKDPRWDKLAREALALAATRFSGPAGDAVTYDQVYRAARAAVDAGCDDPMVLYFYARTGFGSNFPGQEEYERRLIAATEGLEKSQYPPIRRASALVKLGLLKAGKKDDAEARKEAERTVDAALALLPESVKVDGTSDEAFIIWYTIALEAMQARKLLGDDSKAAFDRVDKALGQAEGAGLVRLQVRGKFFIDYAWEARGNGFANTVTEEGFRLFAERLAETRTALDEAWKVRPGVARTAFLRMIVELGIGEGDREQMELWFRRAMEADSDNKDACITKLDWLEPKWYGSAEDMMAFAHACAETKNWRSGIPLLLPDAHYRVVAYFPTQKERDEYFKTPEVWDDIRKVYDAYLKHFPDDNVARSEYAGYSYICGHRDVAREQFEKLGDKLVGTHRFRDAWLKSARVSSSRPQPPAPGEPPAANP